MVRSFGANRRVLLCVFPDADHLKHDPKETETLLISDIEMDESEGLEECELAEEMSLDPASEWAQLLDHEPIVLNDRMMTDAAQSPRIQSEHSYSLTLSDEHCDPHSPFAHTIKLEDYAKDMEADCFPAVAMTTSSVQPDFPEDVLIKQEAPSPPPANMPRISAISSLLNAPSPPLSCLQPQSLLKQPTIVLAARPSSLQGGQDHIILPKVNIKVEPTLSSSGFPLPPTPPSCNGSDSEGSLSPVHGGGGSSVPHHSSSSGLLCSSSTSTGHSNRKSHAKMVLPGSSKHSSNSHTPLISSQPKGATGVLQLTDEEKRTLLAEGYHIPQKLPLTKAEERSLKKIRRKIKNKISAQESRRKKKEYMDALEKKVEILSTQKNEYEKKLSSMEASNKSILSQIQHLQALLGDRTNRRCRNAATQTIGCNTTTQTIPNITSVLSTDFIKKEIPDDFDSIDYSGT